MFLGRSAFHHHFCRHLFSFTNAYCFQRTALLSTHSNIYSAINDPNYNPKYNIVVADVETNSRSAEKGRVIEVAGLKIIDGVGIASFSSLINIGKAKLPPEITEITGISTNMLSKAPSADHVFAQFMDFVGDSVFVAHNASFDYKFIRNELERNKIPLAPCFRQNITDGMIDKDSLDIESVDIDAEETIALEASSVNSSTQVMTIEKNLQVEMEETIDIKEQYKKEALKIGTLCTLMLSRRLFPELESHKLSDLMEHFKLPSAKGHRAMNDVQMTASLWRLIYREVYRRLGFTPPLQFFKRLNTIKASDVKDFLHHYKSLHFSNRAQ